MIYLNRAGYYPKRRTLIGDLTPGAVIYINQDDTQTPYYIAKHDYESEQNGSGLTLAVRAYVMYKAVKWGTANTDTFDVSYLYQTYLTGLYDTFDETAQKAIVKDVLIPYTADASQSSATSAVTEDYMNATIFVPSLTEYGLTATYANTEGTSLPIASNIKIGYYVDGTSIGTAAQWTRSANIIKSYAAWLISSSGAATSTAYNKTYYPRPCFCLDSTSLVDETHCLC